MLFFYPRLIALLLLGRRGTVMIRYVCTHRRAVDQEENLEVIQFLNFCFCFFFVTGIANSFCPMFQTNLFEFNQLHLCII